MRQWCHACVSEGGFREYGATKEQTLRAQARNEITGILAHALERIRGNASIPGIPWIETVLSAVKSENLIASTWALTLLQVGCLRCTNSDTLPTACLDTLIECIDSLHTVMMLEEKPSSGFQNRLNAASWVFLDLIAMSVGLTPLVDWDMDYFDDPRWESQKSDSWQAIVPSNATDAIRRNGVGIFHLLLDLLLFWPSSWDPHRIRDSSGISPMGEARMNHRRKNGQQWTEMAEAYLRHLKLAGLRCGVWPMNQCLFRGQPDGDRALVLCVLLASHNSMHGRLAADYLNRYDGSLRIVKNCGNFDTCPSTISTAAACSLLVLLLGDAKAYPILKAYACKHGSQLWEQIVGVVPAEEFLQRPCLPHPVAARAIHFLLCHPLSLPECSCEKRSNIRLLIDLSLVMAEQHKQGKYWAIRLVQVWYNQFKPYLVLTTDSIPHDAAWTQELLDTFLAICAQVLHIVVEVGETNVAQERRHPELGALPLGVPAPFERRNDLNRLLNSHRAHLKRKNLGESDTIQAREAAYRMISDLAYHCLRRPNLFELPNILLKCAVYEKESVLPLVTGALDCLLQTFKDALLRGTLFNTDSSICMQFPEMALQHQAVPLLPALLDAVCSDSVAARSAALQWISQLLRSLDPQAACHLSAYLINDTDSKISRIAEALVAEEKSATNIQISLGNSVARFLDLGNPEDIALVLDDLFSRIQLLSEGCSLGRDEASVILYDFHFSVECATAKWQAKAEDVKESSGFLAQGEGVATVEENEARVDCGRICGICYDEILGFSNFLPCSFDHAFCRDCFESYLKSSFDEGTHQFLTVRCPQHGCQQRLTLRDIEKMAPPLVDPWKRAFLDAFIERDPLYRFCPGPNCSMIAVKDGAKDSRRINTVICPKCESSFCLGCGEVPHRPAACDDFADWNQIFGSSSFWIRKNAKPCPGCTVPIEKSMGCNHMTCEQCKTQFCWLCLTKLQAHSEAHTCNRYDPSSNAETDAERRALFVTDRFKAHEEAEQFALEQVQQFHDKTEKLFEVFWFLTQEDEEIARRALETLVMARNFLKYSYVAAYGMRSQPERLAVFERYQSTLEMFTERLSQLTETNLHPLYVERGEAHVKNHFQAMNFYHVSVASYLDRILATDF